MKQAQRMQRQMEEQQKELEEKEFTASVGGGVVKAVSYTHLDVYKRQDIIREAAKAGNTGVIHCYSYAAPMAKEYISMGFFIGIGGVLTFKNARVIKEVASEIPLSSIVLETDLSLIHIF